MPVWQTWFSRSIRRAQWSSSTLPEPTPLATPVINEKHVPGSRTNSTGPTPASSTVVENVLPPPATHPGPSTSTRRSRLRFSARDTLHTQWSNFKKHISSDPVPCNAILDPVESVLEDEELHNMDDIKSEDDLVDEVVVDRSWGDEIKSSTSYSDHVASPEKSSSTTPHIHLLYETESLEIEKWSIWTIFTILRFHTWPFLLKVFSSRFADERAEALYAQENWRFKKPLALWAALWLICNWVLGCIFIPHNPIAPLDKVFYFAVAPILSFPVLFMVIYDWPREHSYIYQTLTVFATWSWPFYQVIFILNCGFYTRNPNSCGGRDFMATFYYQTALQAIALFGLKLNRFPAALGAVVFLLFASAGVIPHRSQWGRSMINFFIFHAFLIYVHYMRESSERRLFSLRDQLTRQFKETRRAQQNEKKAADSKRRLTSYVFHEVRVPLNTAMLAVQNMGASGTVAREMEIEFNALVGSLSMMSKVLNDVLDFNRMDSGNFESMSRPYCFHQVMRSLFVPLRLATDARGLTFEANLDPNIDLVARLAAYKAMEEPPEAIKAHMRENPNVDGIVTGDETRLRQIITNLASNACKFTPAGGKLTIKTHLIRPSIPEGVDFLERDLANRDNEGPHDGEEKPLSANYLSQHNLSHERPASEMIVVRIEVSDTGLGIKRRDMARSKLFSAFNQTEQGKQQGGKGTGLGLALVRQIVRLSGGRLGVQSKSGEGSTFWVELPLGVGSKTMNVHGPELPDASKPPEIDPLHPDLKSRFSTKRHKAEKSSERIHTTASGGGSSSKTSALQGIMEQGGRVELVLRKEDYDITPPAAETVDPLQNLALSSEPQSDDAEDSPRHPTQPSAPSLLASDSIYSPPNISSTDTDRQGKSKQLDIPPSIAEVDDSGRGSADLIRRTNPQRPTYVQLPPTSFSMEDALRSPQTGSGSSSHSNTSAGAASTNLTMFDHAFSRASPSTSLTKLNIEPNLPVLVVDDDPLTRTLMKRILGRLGCQVTCAENGEIALEILLGQRTPSGSTPSSDTSRDSGPILERPPPLPVQMPTVIPPAAVAESPSMGCQPLQERRFAVVFLDNQMPVMSGLRVVEKLRELGRTDFVVGVTGNALLSDQEEYLGAGVDCILTKPVQERSLRDVLVQAHDKHKARFDLEPTPQPPAPS